MEIQKEKTYKVYRIVDAKTNEIVGCYQPNSAEDKYDFKSVEEARNSNCHGIFKDRCAYKIAEYEVIEKLITEDCDPATDEDVKINKEIRKLLEICKNSDNYAEVITKYITDEILKETLK